MLVSVEGPNSVTSFDFQTRPPWGTNFVQSNNNNTNNPVMAGVGFAELSFLPPMTGIDIIVKANIPSGDNDERFTVHIQSKQASGLSSERINDIRVSAVILILVGTTALIRPRWIKWLKLKRAGYEVIHRNDPRGRYEVRAEYKELDALRVMDGFFIAITSAIAFATFRATNVNLYYYVGLLAFIAIAITILLTIAYRKK